MNRFALMFLLAAVAASPLPSLAQDAARQPIITRTYVSPGASGSVSQSRTQQGYSGYGGYQVPDSRYNSGSNYQNNSSTQIRGNVQQSIEYPGVGEFQRQPGSRSVETNRR